MAFADDIKIAEPGTDVGVELRATELKQIALGIDSARLAIGYLEDADYEPAMRCAQALHLSIVKAADANQIVARYFAAPPTSSNDTKGK